MTKAYYSAVLDYPIEAVWALIRDFNNYPVYIDGGLRERDRGRPERRRGRRVRPSAISATGCGSGWPAIPMRSTR